MTYAETYRQGVKLLEKADVPEAALDARLLLENVCNTTRNTLLVHGDREVSAEEESSYEELLAMRAKRIPLQQILGVQEFMGLEFQVNEHVLIPRQDTEILVEEVLKNLHDGMRILDMCTGSGCILISLLHFSNDCRGVGADISTEALEIARGNAGKLLSESRDVEFIHSNLFEKVSGKFEIIVSNPPYIRPEVIKDLMPEVKEHEPMLALDGGEDGLNFYREIVNDGKNYLTGGGMLFFEIGYDQGEDVKTLMEQAGFENVNIVQDYAKLDRVVYGTWK